MINRMKTMSCWLATLLSVAVGPWSQTPSIRAQTPQSVTPGERKQAQVEVELSDKTITPDAPVTISVKPKADLQAALSRLSGKETSVRLTVQVRQPKDGDWSGFHVFLNSQEKDLNDLESPHRVGSGYFYGGKEGEMASFILDLGHTIQQFKQAKSWRDSAPLRITLVGIPGRGKQRSALPEIVVTRVTITAVSLPIS